MGMFDDIRCDASLPDDLPYIIPENARWQTKSLESTMSRYTIHENGELTVHMTKWRDSETEVDDFLTNLMKKRVPKRELIEEWEEPVLYHGDIHFYGHFHCPEEHKDFRIELNARFTEGLLDRIWTREIVELNRKNRMQTGPNGEDVPYEHKSHEIIYPKTLTEG